MNHEKQIDRELSEFRESRLQAMMKAPLWNGAVILRRDRLVDVLEAGADYPRRAHHDSGDYMVEPQTRYWVNEAIPRGWASFYVEGDPEAISDREPIGYGAKHLEMYLGGHLSHIVHMGMKAKQDFELKPWMVILGAVVAVGIAAYYFWTERGGA